MQTRFNFYIEYDNQVDIRVRAYTKRIFITSNLQFKLERLGQTALVIEGVSGTALLIACP